MVGGGGGGAVYDSSCVQLPVAYMSPASDLLDYGNHNYGAQTRQNNNTKS